MMMKTKDNLFIVLIMLILTISSVDLSVASPPTPTQQSSHEIDSFGLTKHLLPNSNGPLALTNDGQIQFQFKDWGKYSGYAKGGALYFQNFSSPDSASCFYILGNYPGLQPYWVSEVLIDSNCQLVVSSKQPLELKEGYSLMVKSLDVKGNKLYLELWKNDIPVHHEVLKVVEDPANSCENTYYYEKNMKYQQQNDPNILIAVHFKYAFKAADDEILSIADGIWQISETARQICGPNVCLIGAICDNGRCACPKGQIACSGSCIPMDVNNCGTCGNACANGKVCHNGVCECPDGQTECDGKCFDILSDNNSCGSCGNVCPTGALCDNGKCTCPEGQISCNGSCIPMDVNNCGSCSNVCPAGALCDNGKCTCPEGQISCNGSCIPMDVNNCGSCKNICLNGKICDDGVCECPDGRTECSGKCVDILNDSSSCGSCDNACSAGAFCDNGLCACPEGQIACDGSCVPMDVNNCGSCKNICLNGKVCHNGVCECPDGRTECSGKCIDTLNDSNNCKSCDLACLTCSSCIEGRCIPARTGKQKIVDENDPNAFHSIQDAVNAMEDCDVILVRKGFYKENIEIENKGSREKSLMIIGEGEGQTIIDGGNSEKDPVIFLQAAGLDKNDILPTISLTLADMTIQNGNSQSDGISGGKGGGIAAGAGTNLTIKDCRIAWNKADSGGGIYASGINIKMIGSTISQNKALSQNAGGGGIYQGSPCMIERSTIKDNSASTDGGGILCDEKLVIRKSTITENSVPSNCRGADIFVKGFAKLDYDEYSKFDDVSSLV